MLRCCLKALPWLALPAVGGHRLMTFPELSGTCPESLPVPAYLPLQGHNPVSLQPLPPSGPWLFLSLFCFLNFFNLGWGLALVHPLPVHSSLAGVPVPGFHSS